MAGASLLSGLLEVPHDVVSHITVDSCLPPACILKAWGKSEAHVDAHWAGLLIPIPVASWKAEGVGSDSDTSLDWLLVAKWEEAGWLAQASKTKSGAPCGMPGVLGAPGPIWGKPSHVVPLQAGSSGLVSHLLPAMGSRAPIELGQGST